MYKFEILTFIGYTFFKGTFLKPEKTHILPIIISNRYLINK